MMSNQSHSRKWMVAGLVFCGLSLPIVSAPVSAQQNDRWIAAIKKCTLINNEVARLACFDQAASWMVIAGDRPTAQISRDQGQASNNGQVIGQNVDSGNQDLEAERRRLQQEVQNLRSERRALSGNSRSKGFGFKNLNSKTDRLEASVTKITELPYDRLRIYLNNGQVWDQDERGRLTSLKVGATVVIQTGLVDTYTIKVKDKRGAFKVKRVR